MKHLLNNLSEEEKNSIREQHKGGINIVNERFYEMVNKKLGETELYLNEQKMSSPMSGKTDSIRRGKTDSKKQVLPVLKQNNSICDVICGKVQANTNASGKVVELLQDALITCGYELPKFGADGKYGSETRNAVIKFQKDNGLTVDGGISSQTACKLIELGCLENFDCPCDCKEINKSKGQGNREDNTTITGEPIQGGTLTTPCKDVQKCVAQFMSDYKVDSCLDDDLVRNFVMCLGLGDCYRKPEQIFKNKVGNPNNMDCNQCPKWVNQQPGPGQKPLTKSQQWCVDNCDTQIAY